jgi:phosphoribosyl-ATP pyrophosphohydrolase/phosphoribosyl-AMP cyclohydrolase
MINIDELKFGESGLIPAVVQDFYTKRVLTLAYMNKESLEITLAEGKTCFFSRSRGELWRKGETSGNYQSVISITADCDRDSLVVEVVKNGPACHLGGESCFGFPVKISGKAEFSVSGLYDMLAERQKTRPEGSYTSYLFDKGREKILKKLGEECTEVVIGAMKGDRTETVYELADLCYHAMVLMVSEGISVSDVIGELAARHVIDKKVKQETME